MRFERWLYEPVVSVSDVEVELGRAARAMRIVHVIFSHINNPLSAGGSAIRTHEVYKRMAAVYEVVAITASWKRK